jgi:hypothetical protein
MMIVDFGFLMEEKGHFPPAAVFVLLVKMAISTSHSASAKATARQPPSRLIGISNRGLIGVGASSQQNVKNVVMKHLTRKTLTRKTWMGRRRWRRQ